MYLVKVVELECKKKKLLLKKVFYGVLKNLGYFRLFFNKTFTFTSKKSIMKKLNTLKFYVIKLILLI